jgi:hypothetical protein
MQGRTKWRDVNLGATVPGWTRWSVAEEMLQRLRQANAQANAADVQPAAASAAGFTAFLKGKGVASVEQQTPAQREALFREFLQWEQTRQRTSRQR